MRKKRVKPGTALVAVGPVVVIPKRKAVEPARTLGHRSFIAAALHKRMLEKKADKLRKLSHWPVIVVLARWFDKRIAPYGFGVVAKNFPGTAAEEDMLWKLRCDIFRKVCKRSLDRPPKVDVLILQMRRRRHELLKQRALRKMEQKMTIKRMLQTCFCNAFHRIAVDLLDEVHYSNSCQVVDHLLQITEASPGKFDLYCIVPDDFIVASYSSLVRIGSWEYWLIDNKSDTLASKPRLQLGRQYVFTTLEKLQEDYWAYDALFDGAAWQRQIQICLSKLIIGKQFFTDYRQTNRIDGLHSTEIPGLRVQLVQAVAERPAEFEQPVRRLLTGPKT